MDNFPPTRFPRCPLGQLIAGEWLFLGNERPFGQPVTVNGAFLGNQLPQWTWSGAYLDQVQGKYRPNLQNQIIIPIFAR